MSPSLFGPEGTEHHAEGHEDKSDVDKVIHVLHFQPGLIALDKHPQRHDSSDTHQRIADNIDQDVGEEPRTLQGRHEGVRADYRHQIADNHQSHHQECPYRQQPFHAPTGIDHQQHRSRQHHINARIDQRQPRVSDEFEYRDLALRPHLCVVAILIDFPAVHFVWFVHIHGSLDVLARLRQNLNLRGKAFGLAESRAWLAYPFVVGLHDEAFQFDGYRHFLHGTINSHCPPLRLANGRNHFYPLHVGIAKRGSSKRQKEAEVIQQEGNVPYVAVPRQHTQPLQRNDTQNHRDIHIHEHERPERQHVVQPCTAHLLPRHSHDNRQHHGIH